MLSQIRNTASFIRSEAPFVPEAGIILGTGLGGLVDEMEVRVAIDYKDIPDFPVSTVAGHRGRLIFGLLGGRRVVAMQGRFHYYEGYTMQQVVFPVRVLRELGIRRLLVSNAAGGINPDFHTGDVMVITDHINLLPNPLIGPNIDELGPRFPDMSEPYSRELIALAHKVADERGIPLREGCYVGLTGPSYETQREYGFYRTIGGDAVGMSTTPEVIAARHMNIPVFAVSVITNMGLAGLRSTHEEVQAEGIKAGRRMNSLFAGLLEALEE
ncbi:MAG: purine-nucleoside phosphorylase [Rikenellaceae bacterium]|nr:purine-nucleoside phosphorylase [Rikenellaceae bacterium]